MAHQRPTVGSSRKPLLAGCAALLALTAPAFSQFSGEFSAANLGPGDSDALVGLDPTKDYFMAFNLGEATPFTVNGVGFTAVAGANPAGANGTGGTFTFNGLPNIFPGGVQNPGGVLGQMMDKFVYGSGVVPETLTLDGLTIGESYVVTFYSKSWEAQSVGRRITTTATGASTFAGGFTYDQDMGATGAGSLSVLRYTFQAATTQQLLNMIAQVNGTTMHQYAFTVERTFNNAWTGGADWTTGTWSVGAPVGAGESAHFGTQAAPTTINLHASLAVGHVQFDGSNAWTLSSATGQTLTLQADVGGVSNLSARTGSHVISTNVALANNLLKTGAGMVTIDGVVSGASSVHLGGGTLRLNAANTFTGETVIAAGGVLEVPTISDYGVPSAIGARTFAQENNTVTGVALHFQGGTLRFVGSEPQSTNRQIRMLTGNGATIDASGTVPSATLSFTHSGPNINLFDTPGTRTLRLTGVNTGANTFAIQLTDQGTSPTSVAKLGVGTWHLTNNASTHTGLTQVAGGILNVSSLSDYGLPSAIGARTAAQETATGNGIGIWFGPNVSTGTLQYTGSTAQSTNRQIRVGTGGATFEASGSTPSATMSFTYAGPNTNLYDTGGARAITLTGTNPGANTFAIQLTDQNTATGRTSVNKRGAGTWHLSNVGSTYGGVTAIEGGILNVGSLSDYDVPSALGSRSAAAEVAQNIGILFRGGTLQYTGSTPQSTNRAIRISTNGGATIDASGSTPEATLSFTATSSPDFFENAGARSLTFTGSNTSRNTFATAITEIGGQTSVTKNGPGMWVLTGANTYTGNTTINAGTLRVNGTLANSAVSVASSGALGGNGTLAGPVTINGGGRLAPGDGVGTLTVGSLSLDAGSVLDFELNATASDLVTVTTPSTLTLNGGGINLYTEGSAAPWTTNGTFTLFDYDTTFNGLIGSLTVLNSQAGKFYTVANDGAGTAIRMTISDATISHWNNPAGGQWTTAANWSGGIPNAQGVVAKFGSAATGATAVAMNGPKTVGGVLFDSPNSYTINGTAGDAIIIDNGSAAGGITVQNGSHTIAAPITMAGNLSASVSSGSTLVVIGNVTATGKDLFFSGPGTMVLAGTNSYAATSITSGTLQVGASGTTGTLGSGPVNVSAGATLHLNRSDALTVANNLLGAEGILTKSGAGAVTLTGVNTIGTLGAGIVNVIAGTLALGSANALPANVNLAITGGTLDLNGQNLSAKSLTLGSGAITDTSATPGTTTLDLNAPGTTTVTGNITNGPTRVLAVNLNTGTLQIGDGGTAGSLTAGLLNLGANTALNLNRADTLVVPTSINASNATVNQNGTGVAVFSGTNVFPVLNVNSGTAQVGNATAFSAATAVNLNTGTFDLKEKSVTIGALSGFGIVTDSGSAPAVSMLTISQTTNTVFTGAILDGAGPVVALTKTGTGMLTLGGTDPNTYTGLTTVTNGTLHLQKINTTAITGNVLIGDASGSDVLQLGAPEQIADTSVVSFTAGGSGNSAFFRLNGFNETVRGIQTTVGQSSVLENNDPAGSTSILTVNTAGGNYTYDGIVRNASVGTSIFGLVKAGAGTLTLASTGAVAQNNYTGITSIDDGKMVFENLAGFASPIGVNSAEPGALTINQTTRGLRINAPISGAGAIVKNGPFDLTLGGPNSMTGTLTLNDGILGIANNLALGSATIILNGGNIRAADAGRTLSNPVFVNGNFTLGRLTDLIGPITLNADATITGDNPDGPANFNSALGPIGGNFRVSFADGVQGLGTGAFVINGSNTNIGGTAVLSGRVNVSGSGALWSGPLIVNGGELNFANPLQFVSSISGSGGLVNLGFGHTLAVSQAEDTVFAGALTGTGGFVKSGAGTLDLTGSSFSYIGATSVNEGTLLVTGTLSGSAISVNTGILGGSGLVGAVNSTGGILTPGTGVGTLTAASVQMDAASIWRFELGTPSVLGESDLLQITGTLTLDGTLQVVPFPGFGGGTYRLANYGGALTDNEMVLDPAFLQLYPGSTINTAALGEVNLVVVPEPASTVILLGGLCALAGFRRSRVR